MSYKDVRKTLYDSFVYIRSAKSNDSSAGLTLEHMIQRRIDDIKPGSVTTFRDAEGSTVEFGGKPVTRMSRWDELEDLRARLSEVIEARKQDT